MGTYFWCMGPYFWLLPDFIRNKGCEVNVVHFFLLNHPFKWYGDNTCSCDRTCAVLTEVPSHEIPDARHNEHTHLGGVTFSFQLILYSRVEYSIVHYNTVQYSTC
jgi:hypothetical protein